MEPSIRELENSTQEEPVDELLNCYYSERKNLLYGITDKIDINKLRINEESTEPIEKTNPPQETKKSSGRDWNAEFQSLVDLPPSDERAKQLGSFGEEFVQETSITVQKIVDELALSDLSKRTILPVDIGGIAGGTKFIHNGIFYKMAVDDMGLYGSDESAIKVASHEFRGIIFLSGVKGLSVPLSCIVDYCGMRFTAMAFLPISQSTLLIGSRDASVTIHTDRSDPRVKDIEQQAAFNLKWSPHMVKERESQQEKFLLGPVDLEIHAGTDGRIYAVDTARVFPAVPPSSFKRKRRVSYLVNVFRTEQLQMHYLNADAFSPFSHENEDVSHAFKNLCMGIERLVEDLEDIHRYKMDKTHKQQPYCQKFLEEMDEWPTLLHGFGINLRYFGELYKKLKSAELKNRMLAEMVTRVLKDDLKARLRNAVKMEPEKRLQVAQTFFNDVFDPRNYSVQYWNQDIKQRIQYKYEDPLSAEEMNVTFQIRDKINLKKVLNDVEQLACIHIAPKSQTSTKAISDGRLSWFSSLWGSNNKATQEFEQLFRPTQVAYIRETQSLCLPLVC